MTSSCGGFAGRTYHIGGNLMSWYIYIPPMGLWRGKKLSVHEDLQLCAIYCKILVVVSTYKWEGHLLESGYLLDIYGS